MTINEGANYLFDTGLLGGTYAIAEIPLGRLVGEANDLTIPM